MRNTLEGKVVKYSRPLPVGHIPFLEAYQSFGGLFAGFGDIVLARRCVAGSSFWFLLATGVVAFLVKGGGFGQNWVHSVD